MKRLWVLAPVLLLFVYAEPALAQGGKLQAEGFYIGGGAGVSLTKLDLDEISLIDDTSVQWKAIAGFRWRFFALEFDYRSLSEVRSAIPGSELTAESRGFTGSALLILPVGPIDLFGRVGGHRATSDVGFGASLVETKEWAVIYGGGLGLRLGPVTLRAEYERPQLDAMTDLHQVTGGLLIAF